MRKPTEEQKAKAAEKRANMRALAARISKMDASERAELSARLPGVVTIEGRALSLHNQFMLAFQMPAATVVGGFRQWKAAGRSVRKGQHGACIWFPLDKGKKSEDNPEPNGDEKSSMHFGLATVFDISQTQEANVEPITAPEPAAKSDAYLATASGYDATDSRNNNSPDWSDMAYEDSCREACGL